jgi:hypothetical protein
MLERRAEPRTQLVNVTGQISVDEHNTLPCVVSDRSTGGVRVTLPNPELVPELFVLTIDGSGEVLVCCTAWRKADQIGARADTPENVRVLQSGLVRRHPLCAPTGPPP